MKKHGAQGEEQGLSGSETPDYAAGLPSSLRPPSPPPLTALLPPPTPASYPAPPTPQPQGLMSPPTPMTPMPFSRQSSIPDGPPPTPNPCFPPKHEIPQQSSNASQEKMPLSLTQTGATRTPRKVSFTLTTHLTILRENKSFAWSNTVHNHIFLFPDTSTPSTSASPSSHGTNIDYKDCNFASSKSST